MNRLAIALACVATAACSPSAPPNAPAAAANSDAPEQTTAQAAAIIATLPAPYDEGVYENGRLLFAQCRACHTIDSGSANRVGPPLHGVFNRQAGAVATYGNYSQALKGSAIVWDEATMDAWIANPRDLVPATSMIYPGLRSAEDRRDLVAYLRVEAAD